MAHKNTLKGPVYRFTITKDLEVIWGHMDRKVSDATEITAIKKTKYDKAISLLFRLRELTHNDLSDYCLEHINHVLKELGELEDEI